MQSGRRRPLRSSSPGDSRYVGRVYTSPRENLHALVGAPADRLDDSQLPTVRKRRPPPGRVPRRSPAGVEASAVHHARRKSRLPSIPPRLPCRDAARSATDVPPSGPRRCRGRPRARAQSVLRYGYQPEPELGRPRPTFAHPPSRSRQDGPSATTSGSRSAARRESALDTIVFVLRKCIIDFDEIIS